MPRFNPWWGCTRVSPGCEHCYAETLANRFGTGWGKQAERRMMGDHHWNEPHRWNRKAEHEGRRILVFCASMADVFEDRPELDEPRARLWQIIENTPALTWQLLTKRPENVAGMIPVDWQADPVDDERTSWPSNVWLGTTVEDQKRADERIPELLKLNAAVRFLSCEPLVGPVDLTRPGWLVPVANVCQRGPSTPQSDAAIAEILRAAGQRMGGRYVDWVIVGGESGPGHRPLVGAHMRAVVAACQASGVPVFVKQDSGPKSGEQGRIPDELWVKQMPAGFQR